MEKELGEIKAVLKKYGQEHLLNNFENLDEAHKKELLKEIKGINFELVTSLYDSAKRKKRTLKMKLHQLIIWINLN